MAEAIFNDRAKGQGHHAYSAGISPAAHAKSAALDFLASVGIATDGLRPQSIDDVLGKVPDIDLAVTLCDKGCPNVSFAKAHEHWDITAPSHVENGFDLAYQQLGQKISLLCNV